jgi:Kef-type K+ transport system membrane component KefB
MCLLLSCACSGQNPTCIDLDGAAAAAVVITQAVVIAAALSMSSSAFVLQLLSERGEAATKTGSATLGILLFQVRISTRIEPKWTIVVQ